MRGAGADPRSEGLKALANCHDKGTFEWGTVDPGAREVLGLEAGVRGHLQ